MTPYEFKEIVTNATTTHEIDAAIESMLRYRINRVPEKSATEAISKSFCDIALRQIFGYLAIAEDR